MGFRVKDALKWPNNTVVYDFVLPDPAKMSDSKRATWEDLQLVTLIENCMARWEYFVNQYSDPNSIKVLPHIRFVRRLSPDDPCKLIDLTQTGQSGVGDNGYDTARKFTLNWETNPESAQSIPHELGHILGLTHENNRNTPGIAYQAGEIPRMCPQGDMATRSAKATRDVCVEFGAYDIWSIMHYPATLRIDDFDMYFNTTKKNPDPKEGPRNAQGWTWNCTDEELIAWMKDHPDPVYPKTTAFNYPSLADIKANDWYPSAGDIATLRNFYPVKQT